MDLQHESESGERQSFTGRVSNRRDDCNDGEIFATSIKRIHPSTWIAAVLFVVLLCLFSAVVVLSVERAWAKDADKTVECLTWLKSFAAYASGNTTKMLEVPDDEHRAVTSVAVVG